MLRGGQHEALGAGGELLLDPDQPNFAGVAERAQRAENDLALGVGGDGEGGGKGESEPALDEAEEGVDLGSAQIKMVLQAQLTAKNLGLAGEAVGFFQQQDAFVGQVLAGEGRHGGERVVDRHGE